MILKCHLANQLVCRYQGHHRNRIKNMFFTQGIRILPNDHVLVEEKLTVLGFVDDVKGVLTSVEEFHRLDRTLASFESASGSRLHRSIDPTNQKCSILGLGKWSRGSQPDSPLDYMKVVDHINLLGVKLARTTNKTSELTGSDLVTSG